MKELIRRAWKVTDSQVHGPIWMAEEHYSLIAKMPDGTNQGDIPAMLQSLLAERFHLVLHHEQVPLAVYALVPAKGGVKIKESSDAAIRELSAKDPLLADRLAGIASGTMMVSVGKGHLVCKQVTMAKFANSLVRYLDRPVVDQTEMTGEYSFVLDWLYEPPPGFPEAALPPPEERVGLPLAGALPAQLGLQLEKRNTRPTCS